MRFAFKTAPQNTTWSDMLTVWRAADDIEVFEVRLDLRPLLSDLLRTGGAVPGRLDHVDSTGAGHHAAAPGDLVTGIHHRHPAVLANMAAALDIISGGRLELGIGAGWNEEESDAYGIELGSITERFDRFEEACQVLIGLLSQDTTDFDGRYFQLANARNEPRARRDRTRRSASAATAKSGLCASPPSTPTTGTSSAEPAGVRPQA